MLQHLLVPVDGSPTSLKAAHFAADLARLSGAKITLLTAISTPTMIPLGPIDGYVASEPFPSGAAMSAIQSLILELERSLGKERVHSTLTEGAADDVVLEAIEQLHPDLVVIGSRSQGAIARWVLGSVSTEVVQRSSVPVTVVPFVEV